MLARSSFSDGLWAVSIELHCRVHGQWVRRSPSLLALFVWEIRGLSARVRWHVAACLERVCEP